MVLSRLDLLHALVVQHTFNIDAYQTNTVDKATSDGHFYCDKSCRYDDGLRMGAGSEIRAAKLELHPFARSFKKNPRAMPPLWEYEVFSTL